MQTDLDLPPVDRAILTTCFQHLYSPHSPPDIRKQADQHLLSLQKNALELLVRLLELFEEQSDRLLSFQALVYFATVVKRNWANRRYRKEHSAFEMAKKAIRQKLLQLIIRGDKVYLPTLFDVEKFLVRTDYPHQYPQFSELAMEIVRQVGEEGLAVSDLLVLMMKQMREIFLQVGERKGTIAKKAFQDCVRPVFNAIGALSIQFRGLVEGGQGKCISNIYKISKYSDQILLSLLMAAPQDLIDEQQTANIMLFLQQKLQSLISLHHSSSKEQRPLFQKNIKSLIYNLGLLQNSKALMLGWTLPKFYQVLFHVVTNHSQFVKTACVRYSLIGIKRIFKEFSYYADQSIFGRSVRAKNISSQALHLRRECHQFYKNNITAQVVTNFLNFLMQNPFAKTSHSCLDLDEGNIDKGQEKELNIEECVVWLIQGLLQRFPDMSQELIKSLVVNCLQTNWTCLDQKTTASLLSVVAVLPYTCKRQVANTEPPFPILEVLQFIFKNPLYKVKFAPIVASWLDHFEPRQVTQLTEVILTFLEQQACNAQDQEVLDIIVGCSQCLIKMVLYRPHNVDMQQVIQRAVPSSIIVLGKVDDPSVLWPMVNLVATVITKTQLKNQVLVRSIEGGNLSLLIQNDSQLLVQALCEMLKGFLCVIPRDRPAKPIYELVCTFLNNHLSKFHQINHQKIFNLWYIAIRQYSPIHNCDPFYIELFSGHFRKNLFRKTNTLVYILEEYLLSGLIPDEVQQFVDIIIQCYQQASLMEKDERDKLKIAALSFQITLISKYNLEQVNSNEMLRLVLTDFCNQDQNEVSPTLRNSLLSILNRYLIRFSTPFFHFLETIQLPFPIFLQTYLNNMQCLTSHTAVKINAIALLSILNSVDQQLMLPHLPFIVKVTLPEVELYKKTVETGSFKPMTGVIENSPNFRFGTSVLSQRKQFIRKEDVFETVNLADYFRRQISLFLQRASSSSDQLAAVMEGDLGPRLKAFL